MKAPQPVTSSQVPDLEEVRVWLEKMIAALRFVELVVAVLALLRKMRDLNTELHVRLAQARRARPRSETLARLERQLALPLDGIVVAAPAPKPGSGPEGEVTGKRRRRHPGRSPFPASLPRVAEPNPVPPEKRVCPVCGSEMLTLGHRTCEILDVVPAQVFVRVREDETVACPHDETILSASPPPAIVERGKLGDTLLVEALADKYLDHLPVERQCTRWTRTGVSLAPQTLGRGINAAIDLLRPVAARIVEQTRAPGLLGTDATGLPVLDPDAPEGIRNGTIWCWTNARWVAFCYAATGDAASVRSFLGPDCCRTVQCDGTNLLTFIERAGGKRPGCWSHGRRRLVEAAKGGDLLALQGVRTIALLFRIEKASTLAGDTAEQRRTRRRKESGPVLEELRAWRDTLLERTPPRTPLGQALGYLRRQWNRLVLFLDDGNIELTNNRRERELRRLVLGRRNWLFSWGDTGGERTAAILTILATCIAHEVNPRAYLHVVTKLLVGGWPRSRLRELLPDRMLASHPELAVAGGHVPDGEADPPSLTAPLPQA